MDIGDYSYLLELPFLFIAVFFAFRTARALKGGAFGRGMQLIAYGALVMAFVHIQMQVQSIWGINLSDSIFGSSLGEPIWIIILIATWILTALGFVSIANAAKGG